MTRRELFSIAGVALRRSQLPLIVPVHQVMDARAKYTPEQHHRFVSLIWPEAVRDFGRCGIQLQTSCNKGEVRRSPGGRPLFTGLEHGVINLVVTDRIPMQWDSGRALPGVSTIYEQYHLCMIALRYAHGHQIPFLSVNTCVHELLHLLLKDVFDSPPTGLRGLTRELRIDSYATRLWLFHDGAAIRESALTYLGRSRRVLSAGPELR